MKMVTIPCHLCLERNEETYFNNFSLRDSNIYNLMCANHHNTVTFLENQRYEILFEKGVESIRTENFSEAIFSFKASLERFYEFCIRVFTNSDPSKKQVFSETWKVMSKHSERQLGAFVGLWIYIMKEPPPLLSDKHVELRNNVIHNGKFASIEEALKFGADVGIIIQKIRNTLKKRYNSWMRTVGEENLKKFMEQTSVYKQTTKINSIIEHSPIKSVQNFEEIINKPFSSVSCATSTPSQLIEEI